MPYPDPMEVRLSSDAQRLFPLRITAHIFEQPPQGFSEMPDFDCIPAWGSRLIQLVHSHADRAKSTQLSRERIPLGTQTLHPDLLSQNAEILSNTLYEATSKLDPEIRERTEARYNAQTTTLRLEQVCAATHAKRLGLNLNSYYEYVLLGLLAPSHWRLSESRYSAPPISFGGISDTQTSVVTKFFDAYLPFATATTLNSIIQIERHRRQINTANALGSKTRSDEPKIAV